jgi:NitT/TauT family transport system substrate-binding protein
MKKLAGMSTRQPRCLANRGPNRDRTARAPRGRLCALAFAFAVGGAVAVAAGPAGAETATLRVDWLYRSYHAPFFVGIEKGWYRQAGIDLVIKEGRGSGSVVQLVGNGSDTFGFATADAVIRGVQSGIPAVSVANIMPKNADAIFVLKSSGISRVQDLKGRRIATTPGGASDALLGAFLKGAGLTRDELSIVPLDAAVKVQMLLLGKVDAINAPAWSTSTFTSAGGAKSFLYADYGVQVVGYGIITHIETAKQHPDLVKRFVAVTLRAWQYSLANPEEALAALEKVSAENATPEARRRNQVDLPEVFELVKPAVAGKPYGTQSEPDWEDMQKQLVEYGIVRESRPVSYYLTNAFVP